MFKFYSKKSKIKKRLKISAVSRGMYQLKAINSRNFIRYLKNVIKISSNAIILPPFDFYVLILT